MKIPKPFNRAAACVPVLLCGMLVAMPFAADASMAFCGHWDFTAYVPPWYAKYHGAIPILISAGALGFFYFLYRRRNAAAAARKNLKWFVLVFVTVAPVLFFQTTIENKFRAYTSLQRELRMAEKGDTSAQGRIGDLYLKKGDYKAAYFWLTLATNANPTKMRNIDLRGGAVAKLTGDDFMKMYANYNPYYDGKLPNTVLLDGAATQLTGDEIMEVYEKARVWVPETNEKDLEIRAYVEMEEKADPGTQRAVGLYFKKRQGKGGFIQYAEAAKWLRKAAEQDDGVAQYELAAMYAKGEGVPQDLGEALYWYLLSSPTTARSEGARLLKRMKPQQILGVHKRFQAQFPGDDRLHKALSSAYRYSGPRQLLVRDPIQSRILGEQLGQLEMTEEILCNFYKGACDEKPVESQ